MTTRPPRSLSVETAERHQDYQSMLGSAVSPPSSSSITTSNLFNNESCSSSSSSHRAQLGFSSFNYPGYGQRFGADAGPGAATSAERRNEVVTSSSLSLEQDLLTSSSLSPEQDLLLLDLENNRNHEPSWRNRSEQLHNHPHQATQPSQRRLRAPAPPAPAPPSLPPSPPLSPSLSPSPPQSPNSCYLSTPFIIGSASPTMINERLPQINAATDASSVHEQKYSRLVKNCKRVLVVGISLILITVFIIVYVNSRQKMHARAAANSVAGVDLDGNMVSMSGTSAYSVWWLRNVKAVAPGAESSAESTKTDEGRQAGTGSSSNPDGNGSEGNASEGGSNGSDANGNDVNVDNSKLHTPLSRSQLVQIAAFSSGAGGMLLILGVASIVAERQRRRVLESLKVVDMSESQYVAETRPLL